MSWTTANDLRAQLRRLWERGDLLRALRNGDCVPLRLSLKGPSSTELAECFDAVRNWIADLVAISQIRIEWRELNHRVVGPQRIPQSVWVDKLDDAFALIGRRSDAEQFSKLLADSRMRQPALLTWIEKRPLRALELAANWTNLLAVTEWFLGHPRPGIYLRQVDIPEVHSKFIEAHRGVLTEWLDLVLPPEGVLSDRTGLSQFAARYGFLDKPVRVRFRVLDSSVAVLPGIAQPDITLDANSFASLDMAVHRVFITENETNFLAFPTVPHAIVVFGAGYGWDALAKAEWLRRCHLYYWGDIDTHGFAILDQLRSRFEHVESLLMDRPTLMAHEILWGEECDQVVRDLPRLTEMEHALFDDLRDNRIRRSLRLEQEMIAFGKVKAALANIAE